MVVSRKQCLSQFACLALFLAVSVFLLGCVEEEIPLLQTQRPRFVYAALGSGMTTGDYIDALHKGPNPEYSYANGTELKSLSVLLNATHDVEAHNLAVSSVGSKHVLEQQVPEAVALNPDLVTVLIGPSELCTTADAESFEANLDQIVAELKKTNATILLLNIPNVMRLKKLYGAFCSWSHTRECAPVLQVSDEEGEKTLFSFNYAISRVARRHGVRVVNVYSVDVSPEYVSNFNCFHPNVKGQEKIAELVFDCLTTGVNCA